MKAQISIGALALGLMLAGCGGSGDGNLADVAANNAAPLTQIAAPNNGNWTEIVSETPEGGYRMGNPDAPVKLVEYASITCPHCGEFAETATDPLTNQYVRSGQVSWEYRPYMLFPSDPGIFMLLRCQGPTPFFTLVHQLYATQSEWGVRLQSLAPEQRQQFEGLSPNDKAAAYYRATGLDQFFRQRGMPEGRIDILPCRKWRTRTARPDHPRRNRGAGRERNADLLRQWGAAGRKLLDPARAAAARGPGRLT